jgi:hypothetical protein
MKKFMLLLTAAVIFIACDNDKKEGDDHDDSVTVKMPYTPGYSASFKMGNADYASMVVQGSWKDFTDNKLDNMKNWCADTVVAMLSNNMMVKGVDSLMAIWKAERAKFKTLIDTIDAVMPVYSTDKKENWVLIWARGIGTDMAGKTDTVAIMETWRINKDGKADWLIQFDRANRKE